MKTDKSAYVTNAVFKKAQKKTEIRFNRIDKRFDDIDLRFREIDRRFEKVDQRFDAMDKRFDGIDTTIGRMAAEIANHSIDIKEIKATMMTRQEGQKIIDYVERLANEFAEANRANRIHLNQLMEFRPQLDDHEKRLFLLENPGHSRG